MGQAEQRAEFDRLLRDHRGLIGRIAASYEADPGRQEELCQDIAYAVWRALPSFRGDASVRTFIARVAHNRCATHALVQRRLPIRTELNEDVPDNSGDPENHAVREERLRRLLGAIRRLPLGARQVVSLALEGFSHGEIAETLGIAVNSVDAQLSRARRRLNEILGGPDERE